MKKFLIVLLILLLGFGGYILYDTKTKEKIPRLETLDDVVSIDELYIYGTHLNMHGKINSDKNLEFVLYNGEFIVRKINFEDGEFNFSDKVNEGIYLDDIPRGNYFLFLRYKDTNDKEC